MGAVRQVNQVHPEQQVIQEAAKVLVEGGVLVMPTDSVYGIGCLATPSNPAHERIFAIKRRDRAQTLPWLVADVEDLDEYAAEVPAYARALARRYWPGALTLVVRAARTVPEEYRAAEGTIALRCPDSTLVRMLAREAGAPLATTSANTHGAPAAVSGVGVEDRMVAEADLTLDAGPAPLGCASTIVDCTGPEPRVLREEALSATEIASATAG